MTGARLRSFAIPSESESFVQSERGSITTGKPTTNGEPSGATRSSHGAFQPKLDLHSIARAFIHGHCYGRTYTAATGIRRVRLSEPSTLFFPVAHTFPLKRRFSWGPRI